MFDSIMNRFEESFPSAALYADYAKGNIEESKSDDSEKCEEFRFKS